MKILVTGGLGYIGSHVTVLLLESGAEVVSIDNIDNSHIEVLDGINNPNIHRVYPDRLFCNTDILFLYLKT